MTLRTLGRTPLAVGLAAGLAFPAIAGVPAVLDRIPTDSAIVVAIPNVQDLLTDVTAFNAANGESLPPEVAAGLNQIGVLQLLVSQPGMNAQGSAAVVLIPLGDAAPGEAPPMDGIGVLPIEDFAAFAESPFIAGQNPEMEGGVLKLDFFGESVFIRDLDGFAVVGNNEELVADFDGAAGRLDAHTARLGHAGDALAGSSDAMVVANIEALGPSMKQGLAQLEQQAQFLAAMGGGPPVNDAIGELKLVAENFLRDASAGLIGLDVSAAGVALDLSAQFKDDSELARLFAKPGDADELVDNLPRMDFLIAGGVDLEDKGLKTLFDGAEKLSNQLQAVAAAQGGGEAQPTFGFEALSDATGFSGAIGTAPALGGGGLFANSVAYYRVDDTNKAREALRDGVLKANGTAAAGVTYATTFERNAQKIAGVEADVYSVSSEIDPSAAPAGFGPLADPAMIQQMMFGFTGGPNGFIADSGDGLYMTVSKNSQLLERTLNASRGDAPALDDADGFQITRDHLPDNSSAQIYIAADQIANAVGPFLVMMGAQDEFEPADAMPPVGVGIATGEGSFTVRAFMPGDVIGFLAQFAPDEGDFGNGGGGDGGRPPF